MGHGFVNEQFRFFFNFASELHLNILCLFYMNNPKQRSSLSTFEECVQTIVKILPITIYVENGAQFNVIESFNSRLVG